MYWNIRTYLPTRLTYLPTYHLSTYVPLIPSTALSRSRYLALSSSARHEGCVRPVGHKGPPNVCGGFGGV